MSFRSRFRRQQPSSSSTAAIAPPNNDRSIIKKKNKRESISRFLTISPRASSLQSSSSPLATFDACIEACDALASSTKSSIVVEEEEDDDNDKSVHDGTTANIKDETANQSSVLSDCSVLVSPDGALLFTSQTNNKDGGLIGTTSAVDDENEQDCNNKYPWTKIPNIENRDGGILQEEYESAVICGNDLHPSGDYGSNGFSARGWDCDATTSALRTSCDVLQMMEGFVEELALCRKEEAARVVGACATLSMFREKLIQNDNNSKKNKQRRGKGVNNNISVQNNSRYKRVGPLLSSGTDLGTNISIALETMGDYFESLSESDSQHWREACLESSSRIDKETNTNESGNQDNDSGIDAAANFRGMLPQVRDATTKAKQRTSQREKAVNDIRLRVTEAQNILLKQKDWAANQWKRVQDENDKIDQLLIERREEQHHYLMNEQRQREVQLLGRVESEKDLSDDVWEMVRGVALKEDFGHTGYSPRVHPKISVTNESTNGTMTTIPAPPNLQISRADIERESDIQDIRMVAVAADESVEDASSQLLNIMSKQDTTMRSARVAAESCLLSQCNAVHNCLKSLVAIERSSLEKRTKTLQILETAVDAIDVRKDIDIYIQNDKLLPGGCSRTGDDDDGGVAAALAVLNSHVDGGTESSSHPHIVAPDHFSGWGEDNEVDNDDADDVDPELFGEVISLLFDRDKREKASNAESDSAEKEDTELESYELEKEEKVASVSAVLEEKRKRGQSSRQAILYELNNQRSKKTEVIGETNFLSLCRLFKSFLSGCGHEAIDVSNAKMLMILSQTFFHVNKTDDNTVDRESRVYVKDKIVRHSIWANDEFWDHALEQCVSESLQKSGVLMNYVKSSVDVRGKPNESIKWHDLAPSEYADAAAQVHSVVFAQLGTLAHSMLEMDDGSGNGLLRACDFVRRLSIRYQLPLNLRITLLNHLQNNK